MEQPSSNKSPSTSLEQNKQPYFVESNLNFELISQGVQPLLQGDRNAQTSRFQPSNLIDNTRSLLSSIPFSGEIQAESRGAEDLFGVYLKGISRSHDQHLLEENQVSKSDNITMPRGHDNLLTHDPIHNSSHIHLSSLPSSSRYQAQCVGSSQISMPFRNLLGDPIIVNPLYSGWEIHEDSVPLRIGINQGIPNPMNATSVFNQGSGNTNFDGNYLHYGSPSNQASGSSHRAQGLTILGQKRKMTWEDDNITPNQRRWNLFMQADPGKSSHTSASSSERFTLYDKRYAEMGLPLDPHLRIFNATKEKSVGGSRK